MNNIELLLDDTFGCGNETLGIGGMDGESYRRVCKARDKAQGELLLNPKKYDLTKEEIEMIERERWGK